MDNLLEISDIVFLYSNKMKDCDYKNIMDNLKEIERVINKSDEIINDMDIIDEIDESFKNINKSFSFVIFISLFVGIIEFL